MTFRPVHPPVDPLQLYLVRLNDELVRAINHGVLLDDLADVIITSAAANDTLRFNGTDWVNSNYLRNSGIRVDIGSTNEPKLRFEHLGTTWGVDAGGFIEFHDGTVRGGWIGFGGGFDGHLYINGQRVGTQIILRVENVERLRVTTSGITVTGDIIADDINLKGLTYLWPAAHGAGSRVLTNDGAGNLSCAVAAGGVSDGDKGDITASGGGATWTIDPDVVTYAKMQDVSAASRLLGRGDSGAGDPQEIILGTNLTMSGTTLNAAAAAGAAWTAFIQNLGATGKRSGNFDITGLSGLTADKHVDIMQTAAPIASKGDARDEFEMDHIQLTGYVVDATTIRAYWNASGMVSGDYAFAYIVGA